VSETIGSSTVGPLCGIYQELSDREQSLLRRSNGCTRAVDAAFPGHGILDSPDSCPARRVLRRLPCRLGRAERRMRATHAPHVCVLSCRSRRRLFERIRLLFELEDRRLARLESMLRDHPQIAAAELAEIEHLLHLRELYA
jgi:hypothetical protein